MKLVGATCLGNEKLLIKYVMPYIINNKYDKFVIFDDSDDGSIDEIKNYNLDFIEIRNFSKMNWPPEIDDGRFDWDKSKMFSDLFFELKVEANQTGEEIWYNFMDFDEIIFCQIGLKIFFPMYRISEYGYNYYANKIINLSYKGQNSIDAELINNKTEFIHSLNNVEGFAWPFLGTKMTLFKVNDFRYNNSMFGCGGHIMDLEKEENVSPKNLMDFGFLYSFHLKYLTRDIFIKKNINHCERKNKKDYINDVNKLNSIYDVETSLSFPLKYLFYDDYKKNGYKMGEFGGLNILN